MFAYDVWLEGNPVRYG